MSFCAYCLRRFSMRVGVDEPPEHCPNCGSPSRPSLNGPLVVRSLLREYSLTAVTVNGVPLTETR